MNRSFWGLFPSLELCCEAPDRIKVQNELQNLQKSFGKESGTAQKGKLKGLYVGSAMGKIAFDLGNF